MLSFLERLRNDEGGYGMAFAAFTLFTLVCFVSYTVNVSDFTSRRIKTQGAIDAGVHSAAKQQADMLTAIAVINIIMRVLYGVYMIGFILWLIPWTTSIGMAIMRICQVALMALNMVERVLATAFSWAMLATVKSKVSDNLKQPDGSEHGSGASFGPEFLPAVVQQPMGALYYLIDDKINMPDYLGNYMKADDDDDRLLLVTVGATKADDISNVNIERFPPNDNGIRITPLIFYEGTDDGLEKKKDKDRTFFDKGIMGIAKWNTEDSPPLLGGYYFRNPDLSAGAYGSGTVLSLGAARAWNSNFKRSNLDSFDNHYRTGWKPKLIDMREAGFYGAASKDGTATALGLPSIFHAVFMGEIGLLLYGANLIGAPLIHH